jgi:adenine/guanine phosphoribosyltransferase-like PRPP-binding protein
MSPAPDGGYDLVAEGSLGSGSGHEKALSYSRRGSEPQISSLLIVDDTFSRGRTATAVLEHLGARGFPQQGPKRYDGVA